MEDSKKFDAKEIWLNFYKLLNDAIGHFKIKIATFDDQKNFCTKGRSLKN